MTPKQIFKQFGKYFPEVVNGDSIEIWYSYGKNAIRIKLKNHQEYIFTYGGKNRWMIESMSLFIERMKTGK